jgi:uncharacterized protein
MSLTWDEPKRQKTLAERGLDFARCDEVFSGVTVDFEDTSRDYGERRVITLGLLDARVVFVVSTERADSTRIISMRLATRSEKKRYEEKMG